MKRKYYDHLMATGLLGASICYSSSVLAIASEAVLPEINRQAQVKAAIDRFEQTALQHWAFCLNSAENEEGQLTSSVECFDPRRPAGQQWLLQLSNGQPAGAEQQRSYQAGKKKQAKQGRSLNVTIKLSRLIVADSVRLSHEDAKYWYGDFTVDIAKLGKTASKQLQGQLRFDKSGHFIDQIEINNRAAFSPMFGSNIHYFQLKLSFIQLEQTILQLRQDLTMRGTFAFVTPIDEVSSDVFTDFQYVGPVTAVPSISAQE